MSEPREIKINGIYKHFKNKYYKVEDVAFHSETKEEYVVYRRLYDDGSLWIREKQMFLSEVDHVKYPDVKQKWRFELVEDFSEEAPYHFYGWKNADVKPVDSRFASIKNPRVLYEMLLKIWCADTCAPRMRANWKPENPTYGQCSITAFLVQDIFGGEVYGILRQGGNFHCYNVIGNCIFDLTSEQFGDEKLDYANNPQQSREIHFSKEEKKLRYEKLKEELLKLL